MEGEARLRRRILPHLDMLYGARAEECFRRIVECIDRIHLAAPSSRGELWDERDVVLVAYGDHVRDEHGPPLAALGRFLADVGLDRLFRAIHVLPCFPYSSDDGFSVIDYRQIDPALGDWDDIGRLARRYKLMLDLVLNHVSRASRWFAEYLAGREPFVRFFIEVDPATDLAQVTRPRSLPLLTPVETSRGRRHVWTTFSDDQIDLNYAEPDVLVEMIDVLLFYIAQGARILRLDAIAYLWKRPGTRCIHLDETHAVVKLLRGLVDVVAPGVILLTETNVPHEENVSYFGQGDEAQMIYQFSLAPLLLEALLFGQADLLVDWLAGQGPTPPGATVLNFTASHDGIGMRPLEGVMSPERIERLVQAVRDRGGLVSTRRGADGRDSPYELNTTYFSALAEPGEPAGNEASVRRFLASQAVMLSLRGVPAVYFSSLFGSPSDRAGAEKTGRARSINRRKFEADELRAMLRQPESVAARVLSAYRQMLAARIAQSAFHPEAAQTCLRLGTAGLLGFVRTSRDERQRILVLANLTPQTQTLDVAAAAGLRPTADLLGDLWGDAAGADLGGPQKAVALAPYQVAWFVT